MATGFPSYPTHSEAQALASLATTSATEPFTGIQYFHELLRVLRDPAIARFLFASDPIELQHLLNPQLPLFSVSNDMYETNVEPDSNPLDSLSDHWNSRQFSFPALSSDGRTFGFLVSQDTYIPSSAWGFSQETIENLSLTRFVKEHNEGFSVFVAYYKEFNAYRLEYTKLATSTRQVRFLVAVDASVFQNLRQRESLFVKDMLPALQVMQMSIEHRICPNCSLSAQECLCPPPVVKPVHPFDYNAFRKCAMNHAGVFEGRTALSLFAGGVHFRSGLLGSRFVSRPRYDIDLVEGLRRLAINKHVGGETARHSNIFVEFARNVRQARVEDGTDASTETALGDCNILEISDASGSLNVGTDTWDPNRLVPFLPEETESPRATDTGLAPSFIDAFLGSSEAPERLEHTINISEEMMISMGSEHEIGSQKSTEQIGKAKSDDGLVESELAPRTNEGKSSNDNQVKHLKAELRKERNRASAQRSNMRKKAMTDALKSDLKTTREKADLLRSQEMLLRKQNIYLKQQVAEKLVKE
ncbi:unnamed protein product [Agarophyton chilense]